MLLKFWNEEDGQDLVEYALLMAFIAMAAVGTLSGIRANLGTLWKDINNSLSDAVTAAS